MRLRTFVAIVLILVLLTGVGLGVAALFYVLTRQPAPWDSGCAATVSGQSVKLTPEQAQNAAIIAGVAGRRGLPTQAVTIALATAWQESGLRNLDYGDRDSLGLFQQRPSQGWGTAEQVKDPWYAANKFYAAMEKVKGWQTADPGDVAQAVQRSGYPDAYDKHIPRATLLASVLAGDAPGALTCAVQDRSPADAPGLSAFLAKTLPTGSKASASGKTVVVANADARAAASASSITVAVSASYGVTKVSSGGQSWTYSWPLPATWAADDQAPTDTRVVVVVG